VSSGEPQPRIRRTPDGRIALRLVPREREILTALAAELAAETTADIETSDVPLDEGLARLRPDAVKGDVAASAAFRELTATDLEEGRAARFATVAETIERDSLDEAQAAAWLGAVNDLRLVHGTRLGVTEETGAQPVDETDPDAGRTIVFLWLGWIEEQLVEALAAGLPEVADPDEPAQPDVADEAP
jgi:hypothetical protein